jgi:hypothetical protein
LLRQAVAHPVKDVVVPTKKVWLGTKRSNSIVNPICKMNNINRDLLVMFNHELMSPQAIEHQVEMLHELLFDVERMDNLALAHEVIDLNKYKVFNKHAVVKSTIREQELKPFVFLNCKN